MNDKQLNLAKLTHDVLIDYVFEWPLFPWEIEKITLPSGVFFSNIGGRTVATDNESFVIDHDCVKTIYELQTRH